MNLYESVKSNLKEYENYYDWKKDIKDMEGDDDIWYSYAENMAEQYPDQYGDNVDSVLQQLICVWKIKKSSQLYKLLLEWYGSEEKLLQEVRNVWNTDDAIYFETGVGYSIFDADLLGGNADGETERKFNSFVQEHNDMESNEEDEEDKIKVMAYGKVYYEYDRDEWENFTDEEKQSCIVDTADQASEEEGHTVYEDEVEVLNESETSNIDIDSKEDYEVYDIADSLISSLVAKKEHALSTAIYKTLNGIDNANRRGAGYGTRLNKKLRELVKQAQAKLNESEKSRNLKEAGLPNWYGIPGIRFIYHGDWSDPEIECEGLLYNTQGTGIEDGEWYELKEELGREPTEEEFEQHMKDRGESIKSDLSMYVPSGVANWVTNKVYFAHTYEDILNGIDYMDKNTAIPKEIIAKLKEQVDIFKDREDGEQDAIDQVLLVLNEEITKPEYYNI